MSYASYLQDPAKPVKPKVIMDASLVVDVLGEDVRYVFYLSPNSLLICRRNALIDRFCSVELKEYRRIFKSTDEVNELNGAA